MQIVQLAPKLVKEALRIKENEVVEVTLTGERSYFDFLDEFTLAISKLGAFPSIRLHTPSYRRRFLMEVPEKYLRRTPPQSLKWIKDFSRHVNIIAENPTLEPPGIPERKLRISSEARQPILELVKHLSISRIHLPTTELAQFYKIPIKEYTEHCVSALDIDYEKLRQQCKKIAEVFKSSKGKIRLITGDQYELECRINGRPIHIEDGSRELPAGSIFVSPIESSVNGKVFLDGVIYQGKNIENIVLTFEEGKIVSSSASANHNLFLQRLKAAYGDKELFAGLGIGLNNGLEEPIGCEILDTRVLGTVHISLGSNLIYGGENFSDLYWPMINTEPTLYCDDLKMINKGITAAKLSV
jgi:aminopeptidase